ncbi:F-box domain, cyclin-like protein [Artemisia annua]|uniref:F-box domain, cyclin-like protein n=1 Tax=Artemisia annua TaxID=35608 RepID=A0A2U1LQ93_ARTAN|nr:F-box domain, cyclin-like protein [Artemisia annua]
MTGLPSDILNLILMLLAASTNGARDLVRVSKTCKKLKEHAEQACVLRVVSFHGLTDDYRKHLHYRDIIFQCARVGNQAAECILGKAFLTDFAFRYMISSNDQPTRDENGSYVGGPLQHPRLVRSFIRLASSKDINNLIFIAFNGYILQYAGFEKSNAHGMFNAVRNMFLYELIRLCEPTRWLEDPSPNNFVAQVMPPHDVAHREEVIVIFDKLFPLTHV